MEVSWNKNWSKYGGFANDPYAQRTRSDWERADSLPWGMDFNERWTLLKRIERYDRDWAYRIIRERDLPSVHHIKTEELRKVADDLDREWAKKLN